MTTPVPHLLAAAALLGLAACSDKPEEATTKQAPQDHVWKAQTDAIDKARAVEGTLKDAASQIRQQIQEQSE